MCVCVCVCVIIHRLSNKQESFYNKCAHLIFSFCWKQ